MSRWRRAAIAASFNYLQYGLAMVSGLVLVPLTLRYLGARTYGLWLASGELLGYAAMADLGVMAVLPWMLAEADGRKDRTAMRALLANGVVVGLVVGACYALAAAGLWLLLPSALRITAADRAILAPPLTLLVAATAALYPLRVFSALVAGLQDVKFNGLVAIGQHLLAIALTVGLLLAGHGLSAIVAASVAASAVTAGASIVRCAVVAPDLLRGWPRPSFAAVRGLLGNGIGAWLGAFGWQLLIASNGIVITAIGRPEWVAVWACTVKLMSLATQLAWVMPDAALIGLAQVNGEGQGPARLRPLVLTLLRLHLLLAGGAAAALLAFNPAFVVRWVGPDLFGGTGLNALLAAGIVSASLVHGVLTCAAVVGHRLQAGLVTLANGVAQLACAWVLGRAWGLPGIAAASLVAAAVAALPAGLRVLHQATGLRTADVWRHLLHPWLRRSLPLLVAAGASSVFHRETGVAGAAAIAAMVAPAYVWWMRPLYVGLPFDDRLGRWLVSLRLVPAPSVERA